VDVGKSSFSGMVFTVSGLMRVHGLLIGWACIVPILGLVRLLVLELCHNNDMTAVH